MDNPFLLNLKLTEEQKDHLKDFIDWLKKSKYLPPSYCDEECLERVQRDILMLETLLTEGKKPILIRR